MDHQFYVYIITNRDNTTLYTGVTNNLIRRIYEHKEKLIDGFSKRYNCDKLVWYEIYQDSYNAILREKQIKAGSRKAKILLVNNFNKEWKDMYEEIL
jgi:putative endonuclease